MTVKIKRYAVPGDLWPVINNFIKNQGMQVKGWIISCCVELGINGSEIRLVKANDKNETSNEVIKLDPVQENELWNALDKIIYLPSENLVQSFKLDISYDLLSIISMTLIPVLRRDVLCKSE